METRTFVLAIGERVQREIAQIGIGYEGHRAATSVMLGDPGDAVPFGALAPEGLGYEADAVHRTSGLPPRTS